ncbi:MAG: hypothetical protein ABIN89_17925 [Chitinophagaceae bacterium]
MNFEVDGSTYPWEVHDEGISLILDNMTSMAGINFVYVLAVMHKEHRPYQSPEFLHNPVRTIWDAEDSRVYFLPEMGLYKRIKPIQSRFSWLSETNWVKIVVDSAHARGLKAGAEVSHTYIPVEVLQKNPEFQQRDINNKPLERPCTNNPDVRDYLIGLFGDLSKNYNVDFIQTCIWLFFPGNPEKGGSCFCEACQKEAKTSGFDLTAAMPILRDNPNAQPQLDQWLKFRRASTVKIYKLIADRIHQNNPKIDFRLNEIYPFSGTNDNSTGLYLEDLKGIINSCVIQEHTEQKGYANTLRKSWLSLNRSLLGPGMPLLSGIPTRMASTPELIKNAIQTSVDGTVQGIAVKHYDGSPYSLLRAVRSGLKSAGVQGFTPVQGLEVENMALTGYSKDVYKNEPSVQTPSSGTATAKFNSPSGVYNVVISYADEKDGQGTITLFVANKQRATFKLSEDVGVWRRKTFNNIKINNGDEIKLVGVANGSEAARIDFIEFIPQK